MKHSPSSDGSSDRLTLSFYCYQPMAEHREDGKDLDSVRDELYACLCARSVLGRVYVASEGVNGQVSVPADSVHDFQSFLGHHLQVESVRMAIEEGVSFEKLTVKIKQSLVADGHSSSAHHDGPVGEHVDAQKWHALMDEPDSVVIDVRNDYEHEVGHFKGAKLMNVSTFRDQFAQIADDYTSYKKHKVLLYCTGGIRCEKTSTMMMNQGYEQVYQLRGGILEYKKQIDELGLKSRFVGKNFVFDKRLSERVTDDVVSQCYNCGVQSDEIKNCAWMGCNALFVQCPSCDEKYDGCCSEECAKKHRLSLQAQKAIVRHFPEDVPRFKSRFH